MAQNNLARFPGGSGLPTTASTTAISIKVDTANTTKDGTGGSPQLLYTVPTDGALLTGVWFTPLGTNVASVGRVFINNGNTLATAGNNHLAAQKSLPAVTNTETGALPSIFVPIPPQMQDLPANYRIYITIGTSVAAGYSVCPAVQKWAA